MSKKYYKIVLDAGVEINVFFETMSGLIITFVVKLTLNVSGVYHEVIRYDSAHNCPHKDILDVNGNVKRKVWFDLLDNKQALDLAVKDLKDNYELYVERFLRWLKK